jgi:reactive chlorine resistance protein C
MRKRRRFIRITSMATMSSKSRLVENMRPDDRALHLTSAGTAVLRYGLALILLWIGFLKFQPYEAVAIMPLVAHSPFMAWMIGLFGLDSTSHIIGTYEIGTAVLIALRPVSARLSMIGGVLAIITFLGTLSFLFTTPAMALYAPDHAFPFFGMVGQFLIKDVVLLGAAIYVAGEAWLRASTRDRVVA